MQSTLTSTETVPVAVERPRWKPEYEPLLGSLDRLASEFATVPTVGSPEDALRRLSRLKDSLDVFAEGDVEDGWRWGCRDLVAGLSKTPPRPYSSGESASDTLSWLTNVLGLAQRVGIVTGRWNEDVFDKYSAELEARLKQPDTIPGPTLFLRVLGSMRLLPPSAYSGASAFVANGLILAATDGKAYFPTWGGGENQAGGMTRATFARAAALLYLLLGGDPERAYLGDRVTGTDSVFIVDVYPVERADTESAQVTLASDKPGRVTAYFDVFGDGVVAHIVAGDNTLSTFQEYENEKIVFGIDPWEIVFNTGLKYGHADADPPLHPDREDAKNIFDLPQELFHATRPHPFPTMLAFLVDQMELQRPTDLYSGCRALWLTTVGVGNGGDDHRRPLASTSRGIVRMLDDAIFRCGLTHREGAAKLFRYARYYWLAARLVDFLGPVEEEAKKKSGRRLLMHSTSTFTSPVQRWIRTEVCDPHDWVPSAVRWLAETALSSVVASSFVEHALDAAEWDVPTLGDLMRVLIRCIHAKTARRAAVWKAIRLFTNAVRYAGRWSAEKCGTPPTAEERELPVLVSVLWGIAKGGGQLVPSLPGWHDQYDTVSILRSAYASLADSREPQWNPDGYTAIEIVKRMERIRFQSPEATTESVSDVMRDCYRMPFGTSVDPRRERTIAIASKEGIFALHDPEEAKVVEDLLNAMIASMISRATTLSTPPPQVPPGQRDLARMRLTIESVGQYIDTAIPPVTRNLFPIRRSLVLSRTCRITPESVARDREKSTGVNALLDDDEPRHCSRFGTENVCQGCCSGINCDEECQMADWEDGYGVDCAYLRDAGEEEEEGSGTDSE